MLGGRTYPANGARFADRGVRHLGMLRSGSALTRAMRGPRLDLGRHAPSS